MIIIQCIPGWITLHINTVVTIYRPILVSILRVIQVTNYSAVLLS